MSEDYEDVYIEEACLWHVPRNSACLERLMAVTAILVTSRFGALGQGFADDFTFQP